MFNIGDLVYDLEWWCYCIVIAKRKKIYKLEAIHRGQYQGEHVPVEEMQKAYATFAGPWSDKTKRGRYAD